MFSVTFIDVSEEMAGAEDPEIVTEPWELAPRRGDLILLDPNDNAWMVEYVMLGDGGRSVLVGVRQRTRPGDVAALTREGIEPMN